MAYTAEPTTKHKNNKMSKELTHMYKHLTIYIPHQNSAPHTSSMKVSGRSFSRPVRKLAVHRARQYEK